VDQRICEFYKMLVCFSTPSSLMQSWRFEIFGSSLMILSLVPKSRLTRGWKAAQVFESIGGRTGTRPPDLLRVRQTVTALSLHAPVAFVT